MKIVSWNVNGIRAVIQKGFFDRINQENPDIICLQEVKAFEIQLPTEVRFYLGDYNYIWHQGTRPGYAGTAIFYKKEIDVIGCKTEFSFHEFYDEGRVTELLFNYKGGVIHLLNVYFPNGGNRADGTEMLTYKLDFYEKIREYVNGIRQIKDNVIICGDFNICHTEIDIARPKENENSIGFLPIERAEMDKLEDDGLVDVFRKLNPFLKDQYTWWSYRGGAREKNVGWRLDYFWISPDIVDDVGDMQHQVDVTGSDHCPIKLELK